MSPPLARRDLAPWQNREGPEGALEEDEEMAKRCREAEVKGWRQDVVKGW